MICFPEWFSIAIPQQGEVIIPRRRKTRAGTINQCPRVKQNKRINLQSGTVTRAVKSVLIIRRGGSKTRGEPKAGAPWVAAVWAVRELCGQDEGFSQGMFVQFISSSGPGD